MKIGVYGGTFNPIHLGHIHILREFVRRLSLDRVLLIPARVPPHKQAPSLASPGDRFAMCALAAQDIEEVPVKVSPMELDRDGKSYTADTLEALRALHPRDELYLLMGEDMFLTVDSWYRPETIFRLANLCASPRSEDGFSKLLRKKMELEERYGARCFVEDIPYLECSSTEVRALAAQGESIKRMVPGTVADYIARHSLYRDLTEESRAPMTYGEYEAEVKNRLSEKRFYHSQCVAEEAAELAELYGADVEKARLAGILHDIMKDTPAEEQLKIIEESGILLTKTEQANPKLWHSISGAAFLEHRMDVRDPEILSAVRCHTSGKGGMTLLEKVLFVADYISADREYPGVEEMRRLSRSSLEEAIVEGIAFTVGELIEQRFPLAPGSVDAYNDALSVLRAAKKIK